MMQRGVQIVYDSMPAACLVAAAAMLAAVSWQVVDAVRSAHRVHVIQESIVARLVAEEAAFDVLTQETEVAGGARRFRSPTGLSATVSAREDGSLTIQVAGRRGRSYAFGCELLGGAAPRCLGNPLSVRPEGVAERPELRAWLRAHQDVRLEPMGEGCVSDLLVPHQPESEPLAPTDLIEDASIGLLRLQAGSDGVDFRPLCGTSGRWRPDVPEDGVRYLTGNFWVDRGTESLQIELARSLTLVVRGNIYLGRSIQVVGPGRLILVALHGAQSGFIDVDLNGGFSAGDRALAPGSTYQGAVEGSGSVYLGLPGDRSIAAVEVDASLVSAGETYVLAGSTVIRAALVVGEGITFGKGAGLTLTAEALPNVERERLPGFRRKGATRPGMLHPAR